MARYIDADKAYEIARTEHKDFAQSIADLTSLREVLEDTPTADVVEVKHGEWLSNAQTDEYICSECDGIAPVDCEKEDFYKSNYCPYCGAKMDSKK